MKGGRNTEGYADPTATIAVGRVAKEEREQIECEAADKRAYDLIKVLKYIIKGAGFELTERVQVKDTKTGIGYNLMIDKRVQDNYDKLAKTGLQIILMNYLQFIFYCRYLHPEM